MVMTIGEIIQELLRGHQENRDVNLNKLKTRIAAKYGLDSSPKLVDIIAAVPAEVRHILVPKLKAKPIRTASGVSFFILIHCVLLFIVFLSFETAGKDTKLIVDCYRLLL